MKKDTKQVTPLAEALITCKIVVKYILAFGFISNILMLTTPIYSMQVLDRVLSSGNLNTLLMLTLVIFLALALLSLIQAARAFAMNRLGIWFEHRLGKTVFRNAVRASLDTKNSANSQQIRDLQTIKNYLTSPGVITIMDLPWALIFLVVLFFLHSWIGMLTVIGGALLIFLGFLSDKETKNLIENNNDNFMHSMRYAEQATRNAEVVEVMGLSRNLIDAWSTLNNKVQNTHVLLVKKQTIFGEVIKFIRTILQISVTGIGALLVVKGEFSAGAIIASSSLVGRALAPFEAAISSWKGFVSCRQSFNRLNSSFVDGLFADKAMSLPKPEGHISVENLYYAPQGSDPVIKGVNFSLKAGECLAIIGPSASGKTTLAKLLIGAYRPASGVIRLDKANLQDWHRDELGRYLGYLPQDVELFNTTLKENIARMDSQAEANDIIAAAQMAGVHEMILNMPNAYNTQIGYDGVMLSGGQRQRIGLARALYGNPRFMVLDEPNANLDTQGEAKLEEALLKAKAQGITTVIISHRDSILKIADKVMLLRQGAVDFFGTLDELKNAMD